MLNTTVKAAIADGQPAISVDTKKKELVGDFKNPGRELRRQQDPEPVRVHDFKLPELGKVAPYGVYDIAANHGWVSIGVDADTAAFAVESIRRWWQKLGRARYPDAHSLTITADCGGSNGVRVRLWKRELQRFANETSLKVTVTHLPPGTSKWNRIVPSKNPNSFPAFLQPTRIRLSIPAARSAETGTVFPSRSLAAKPILRCQAVSQRIARRMG